MSNQVETIVNIQTTGRNKTTIFWRGILVVPISIFLGTFSQTVHFGWSTGLVVLPVVLSLLVRGIYPSYVLNFNHALMELQTRVMAYVLLLTDDYPSIERNPNIAVLLPDVNGGKKLSRGLPLIKWLLAIPLYLVGCIYSIAALLVTVVAWVITWSTGNYPEWALSLVLGTITFWNRVYGYAIILVTDEYPSFKL